MRRAISLRAALVISSLAVTACAAAPDEQVPPSLDGTAWALASAAGGPLAKAASDSGVTLAFDAGNASGSGGCNQYRATYTLDGTTLRFGAVGATKRGCMDDRSMIEATWFGVLNGPLQVSRSGDRLELRDASGTAYTFGPAPAEAKP